ncbi:hypothetical protein I6A60_36400 [Frankia sp. AgB1.9]|uniref:DUF6351 family protein n=1 Tax=unclassified Frankia TaxID=2632575 RepID=UPI0019331595|nr:MULTISPECIES: DUF6351 family protein [unclassified Frankia]MBL7490263.1 hypothetical protein [Frankia sp. AgW1.1]MBL7553296.1 hypothetical protein [Frankia sp. AgB1.9]MBL7624761.1 hypothetical protein [Frankia sp. AgB1.8]
MTEARGGSTDRITGEAQPPAPKPAGPEPAALASGHRGGILPGGTEYQIQVPANWNGTVINDLDAVDALNSMCPQARFLLDHGYAYSGTTRRSDRNVNFDPRAECEEQAQVLDIFTAEYGAPSYAIQFGCSGGGRVALRMAEGYPDRVDGAISLNGVEGIVVSNDRLDLLFALKALLAPDSDLPIVGISVQDSQKAQKAWVEILDSAQKTPSGRAKISLAGALAKWPTWGGMVAGLARPDPDDKEAVQQAMINSVIHGAIWATGNRHIYDGPAGVVSWNTGIDYEYYYADAEPDQKEIVGDLYTDARLNLQSDLSSVNAYPRITAAAGAVDHSRARGLTGNPQIPVLQINTEGDSTRSAAMMAAYAEGVTKNGKSDLYRQALIEASGHCTHNPSEMAAAVDTMMERLKTGSWGDRIDPARLNATGRSFGLGEPRFIATAGLPTHDNRAFFPDSDYPGPH